MGRNTNKEKDSKSEEIIDIKNLFVEECSILRNEDNRTDVLVFPKKIEESDRAIVRLYFGISNEEKILFVRDTSFWNGRNQGLVITDWGIYCIPDNDDTSSAFRFGWDCIVDVYYQELSLYFKDTKGDQSYIHMSYFVKSSDENHVSKIGKKLAIGFKKIADSVVPLEDPFDSACKVYEECIQNGKYNDAVDVCIELINNGLGKPCFFYELASSICCQKLNDFQKGMEYALKGMDAYNDACKEGPDDSNEYCKVKLLYDIYNINHANNNDASARKDCLTVMLNATDQNSLSGDMLMKDEAKSDFAVLEKSYVDKFLTLPYNERKVIMPVKEYVDLHQDRVAVIRMDNLPAMSFPMGHPIANQLYVGHPLIPSKYIPFENYQLELVEDKVREFCMLAQSLGATEISIECLNSTSSNENESKRQNISGEAGNKLLNGKGDFRHDRSRQMIDELSHSICIHQTFTPCNKPSVPENMVWYADEPSWQRLVSQRMNGGLSSHEERIETKKSQMVEGRELNEIKAEVNTLYADMKMSISEEEEAKFAQQENAVLAIKVKFAPISQLTGSENTLSNTSFGISTSSSEEEYLAELKDILSDGEISPRERRLLEKIRTQLGISESRAEELEASLLSPKLTPEEEEYLNEYRDIIAGGEISPRDQRFLGKLKIANNISEERAKELENMAR